MIVVSLETKKVLTGIGCIVASLLLFNGQDNYHRLLIRRSDPKTVELKNVVVSSNGTSDAVRRGTAEVADDKNTLNSQPFRHSYSEYRISKLKNSGTAFKYSSESFPFRLHFSTYANDRMRNTRDRLIRQAQRSGWFDSIRSFSRLDIPRSFYEEFEDILNSTTTSMEDYKIWRFPVLDMMMERVAEGEFMVIMDVGCSINRWGEVRLLKWLRLLNESKYDGIGFRTPHPEYAYTTNHLFEAFKIPKDSLFRSMGQIYDGVMILRNGPQLREIVKTMYKILVQDHYLISSKYNQEAKQLNADFIDYRYYQSIHSLAQKIHGFVDVKYLELTLPLSPFQSHGYGEMSWTQVQEMEREETMNSTVTKDPLWWYLWKKKINKCIKC